MNLTTGIVCSGLVALPPNHVLAMMKARQVLDVKIRETAEKIAQFGPELWILQVGLENNCLMVDVGYTYNGGNFEAASDLKKNGDVVDVYLKLTVPTDFKVKGRICRDVVKIPLENECFKTPVVIHLHHHSKDAIRGVICHKV